MARPSHAPVINNADEQFLLLVASVRDYAIFLLDPRGHIMTWNVGAQRIKGYRSDEIIGKHFSVFYPPEDVASGKPARELDEAEREGRFEDEGWRLRKGGTPFWANVVITALRDSSGVLCGFGKVTRDLTAHRKAEETTRRLAAEQAARAMAQKAETFQRDLLAIVGHDLRNCLSVILAAAEMNRLHAQDEKVRERAARAASSAKRMRHIISSLIDYTYAQREGIPISPTEGADFHIVCEHVLQEFNLLHPGRRILYEADGSPVGQWDASRLEQVVQNLVGNALKYGPPGSPVTVQWSRESDNGGDLILTVHNEGSPIPADLLPHIFEPYRSGLKDGGGPRGSMGLGLFIVSEIVRSHGGEVHVHSTTLGGTTFTVRIPDQPPASHADRRPVLP
jgi:PAS domain S-box-containing protein